MAEVIRPDGASIHYEVLGDHGSPVICLGGWGTFCHGNSGGMPFNLIDNHRVIIIDYRGLAESTDNPATKPTMEMYADDAIAVIEDSGLGPVHLLGMVGIGACVCQVIAIKRPDLGLSLVNTGAWCKVDPMLADQLQLFAGVHRQAGWATFQLLTCAYSFSPDFYNAQRDKVVGPQGPWRELQGKIDTHQRFIDASIDYDVEAALGGVRMPALIFHAPLDTITGPRTTQPIQDAIPGARGITLDGAAHVLAGKALRQQFSDDLLGFYREIDG